MRGRDFALCVGYCRGTGGKCSVRPLFWKANGPDWVTKIYMAGKMFSSSVLLGGESKIYKDKPLRERSDETAAIL